MPMTSSYFRPIGVTTAISVGATATSEVQINNSSNDQNNTVALLNTGATSVAVKFGQSGVSAPVLPVSGSTTGDFVLPPNMITPLVYAVPTTPSYVRMIGSGAGPSIVYVTPVGA